MARGPGIGALTGRETLAQYKKKTKFNFKNWRSVHLSDMADVSQSKIVEEFMMSSAKIIKHMVQYSSSAQMVITK